MCKNRDSKKRANYESPRLVNHLPWKFEMKKIKILLWVILLLITHTFAFIFGSMRGRYVTQNYLAQEFEKADAHVVLGHYLAYRDIALGIQASQNSRAKCEAEMMATNMFDSLTNCLANEECKEGLSKKAREFAPEVLGEKPVPITKRMSCP